MTRNLFELLTWLESKEITHLAMESTSIYWRPVYNILEGYFAITLANAQRIKNVPGRKTDVADAEWIAKLLRHGLIEPSFVPTLDLRELRELTRLRKKWVGNLTAEKNRIQKVQTWINFQLPITLLLGQALPLETMRVRVKKSTRTVKGNPHIKTAICEAAWAATRSRKTSLSIKYWKLASRRGKKKAIIAIARKILTIVYHMIKKKQAYIEGGINPQTITDLAG